MRVALSLLALSFGAITLTSGLAGCSRAGGAAGDEPTAAYDRATGRLQRHTFDADQNGRNDSVSVMDGTRIDHIEVDTDENGTVDRWDYYDADRRLVKVGISRQNDGIVDAVEHYENGPRASGGAQPAASTDDERLPSRIDVSTERDGRFDRVEFYDRGVLTRVEEDTDQDGLVDKWELYAPVLHPRAGDPPSSVTSVAFDEAHRGTPTRRLVYAGDGTVDRVEIDPDGDGIFTMLPRRPDAAPLASRSSTRAR